jgi:PhnB protein
MAVSPSMHSGKLSYFCPEHKHPKTTAMTYINPYISFNGNCREAMTFYKECLGGELVMQTVAESPLATQCPSSMQNSILHASLSNRNMILMASDMIPPGGYTKGNDIALSLNCSAEEEINLFYKNLSVDGQILDELKTQFWGAIFGVLTDKFGIRWMLNCDINKNKQ